MHNSCQESKLEDKKSLILEKKSIKWNITIVRRGISG